MFNMIANKNEPKAMIKHISFDSKCKLNSTGCSSNQKWKIKHVNVNVKVIFSAKKIVVGILGNVYVRLASI